MNAMDKAVELVEIGATALMAARPTMGRMEALNTAAIVLKATFPESAAIVSEQSYARALEHRDRDPIAAVGRYAIGLRMQAQDPST